MNRKLELRKCTGIRGTESLVWMIYSIGLWILNQRQMSTVVTVFYALVLHFVITCVFTKSPLFLQFFYVILYSTYALLADVVSAMLPVVLFHENINQVLSGGGIRAVFTLVYLILLGVLIGLTIMIGKQNICLRTKEKLIFIGIALLCVAIEQIDMIAVVRALQQSRDNDFFMLVTIFVFVLFLFMIMLLFIYNLGVEIEENSELDLFEAFNNHAGDQRIPEVVADMKAELGEGNKKPEILEKLAQYELTLLDWIEAHKGSRKYVAIAGKCWPAFQTQFGFVPCYVNSRLTGRGIPVSCEVDIYGALSEFIGTCVSEDAVTLLDINNSVPKDMYKESIEGKFDYTHKDTFMGFHCGNTCSKKLASCEMKNQMIMARSLPVEVTNGTLEGDIAPGDITFYRLQSTSDNKLRAYVAQGEVLPVATRSFGSIGVFAIHEMGRFYRHVLIEKNYPHHGAVAFGHYGKALFEVFKYIGVPMEDINYNQPASLPYPTENPFA